jgi:iron complex outermembrane recepter protein
MQAIHQYIADHHGKAERVVEFPVGEQAGARLNIAQIVTEDATGQAPELNINDTFSRINPVVALTYKILPTVTVYGGYSEANRAPTPLELDCADPNRPCLLENSLVSDPPLKQVVAHTYEAGLRGGQAIFDTGQVDWKAGFFHTNSTNDIVAEASKLRDSNFSPMCRQPCARA